ncbi:MAG: hypothetical protein LBM98_09545 [Oscillospiraceae bacterium]|nr:hypothetical protein [Oscillospiraceae bacterium]
MDESYARWACVLVIPVPTLVLIPSVEGCRRSGGVVSPAGRNPRPSPRNYSLFIINCQTPFPSWEGCRRSGGVVSPAGRTPRPNLRL